MKLPRPSVLITIFLLLFIVSFAPQLVAKIGFLVLSLLFMAGLLILFFIVFVVIAVFTFFLAGVSK
ncbi:MAG: hypothetical protein DSO07_08020 [Thermoproteota archaeon]|jgi:hypothetical protein|uniref:Uncharacterized protein n=1 Tax=Candidatus Methanodesulfokora washburnensis TaxID=2478471 RepID=A0A429GWQ6_9CREN|nr:hypothetical protein [Candidatus Methanodesulfokores washburnensis]RSN78338.1 hypothetical protein D6D85_01245 [Candidatus Methanodesulfokores washburnensis]RZN63269.1 MAG: hypothetical protein EF810_01210 [Candidatus Methanodesulfokores washburnensis]TDA40784.1 MAG: hypothetical protein DSO07_08020 [Candidatus Korarchaeota archaeon]